MLMVVLRAITAMVWSVCQEDTAKMFPYIYEAEGSDYERYVQIRQAPQYKPILDTLPNGDFVAGVLCKGIEAIEAEQKPKRFFLS